MTWIELMGHLLNTTAPKIIPGFRIVFQLWSVASVLLLTAYSSHLASKLTSPSYEKKWVDSWDDCLWLSVVLFLICRIDTPKDFIEANLTWGRNGPEPMFDTYFDTTVNSMKTKILSCCYFVFFKWNNILCLFSTLNFRNNTGSLR